MDGYSADVALRRAFDESAAVDEVFDRFPEETPAEVMALAKTEDGGTIDDEDPDLEELLGELSTVDSTDRTDDGRDDSTPIDVTAAELFGE
jgi:hypothetical protein